jgi:hypothetical protein
MSYPKVTGKRIDDFTILLLSPLFWDVIKSKLNPDLNKQFIICRVMDRGDIEAVNTVMNYYDKATIKEVLTNARFIEKKTITFFANYFDLSTTDFKAWKSDSTTPWNI